MKRTVIIILLSIFMMCPSLRAQDAKQIISKCITAMGGQEGIKKYSQFEAQGTLKLYMMQREIPGSLKMVQKGIKSRIDAEIKFGSSLFRMVFAFDGKNGWMDRMGTIADQPALNFLSNADHTPKLLLEKNATFALSKNTEINGKKALGIEVTFKNKKTTFYIDGTNYTIMEIVFKDLYFGKNQTKEMLEKRIRLVNYKKVDGVPFPFTRELYSKGKKEMLLAFNKVSFDPQVTHNLFARPDQKLDLRYGAERLD